MTETQQRPERPPVRPRSGRRPIPPLVFLLVLALAALAVWWNVLRQEADRQESLEAACDSAAAAVPSLDPATVTVRVLNASDTAGQAQRVAGTLRSRGFVVEEVGNDGTSRRGDITGVGEVRHGPLGEEAARFLAVHQPGVPLYQDTRASGTVDMVIGPEWVPLIPPEAVAQELAAQPTAEPAGC
jgi:LytR cell envelope-related transcriptional attenuator